VKEMVFNFLRKREVERLNTGTYVDEMEDCSINRSRMIERFFCYFKTRGERMATKGDKRGRPSTTI